MTIMLRGPKSKARNPQINQNPRRQQPAAHYGLAAKIHHRWKTESGATISDLSSETYGLAIESGWHGHMGQWARNIEAGQMSEGQMCSGEGCKICKELSSLRDRTPKKIKEQYDDG